MNKEYSHEEIQMAGKPLKCSESIAKRKLQVKTTLKLHLTLVKQPVLSRM